MSIINLRRDPRLTVAARRTFVSVIKRRVTRNTPARAQSFLLRQPLPTDAQFTPTEAVWSRLKILPTSSKPHRVFQLFKY